jgi:hypothetical protein
MAQHAAQLEDNAFASSREAFAEIEGWLSGAGTARLTHAELEEQLDARGRELLRRLHQDHLDLPATGAVIGKRQAEELAMRAAADIDAFYENRRPGPAPDDRALVLTFDGKGIVMRPDGLRPATAKAAAATRRKLATRLSPGEKNGRERMAELACVYDT